MRNGHLFSTAEVPPLVISLQKKGVSQRLYPNRYPVKTSQRTIRLMSPVKQPLDAPTIFMHPLGTPNMLPASEDKHVHSAQRKIESIISMRQAVVTQNRLVGFTLAFEEGVQIVHISLRHKPVYPNPRQELSLMGTFLCAQHKASAKCTCVAVLCSISSACTVCKMSQMPVYRLPPCRFYARDTTK